MVNQQFRRDYWVKGVRTMPRRATVDAINQQHVILLNHRPDVSLKVTGAAGEATMNESIYGPILDSLADHKVKTLGELHQELLAEGIDFGQIVEAIMVLATDGRLAPAQDEDAVSQARQHTDKLNSYLIDKVRNGSEISSLVSPVTGGGFPVGRFHQFFLFALSAGKQQPAEWAQVAWDVLASHGQKLVVGEKTLETREENLAELNRQAEDFGRKELPVLKALQIA